MTNPPTKSQWEALRVFLRKTQSAIRAPIILEGALWYLTTTLAVVLGILALSAVLPTFRTNLGSWILWTGLGAATLAATITLVSFLRRKHDAYRTATLLQRHHPEFRNDLTAALEFGEQLYGPNKDQQDPHFSRALAEAHIARTTRAVLDLQQDGHLGHLIPRRELTIPAISLAAAAVLVLLPTVFLPTWTLNALFGNHVPGAALLARIQERPVVGPLEITLAFPDYMGIERQYIRGSTGYIEAIAGTNVTIRTRPILENTERIEIVLKTHEGGEEPEIIVMSDLETGFHEANFTALHEGTYQFRAVMTDKTVIRDGQDRLLRVLADEPPGVEITSPEAREIEVSPDDIIDIEFQVSDDFGIAAVDRIFYFAGGEDTLDRKGVDQINLSSNPRAAHGTLQFDLKPLGLQPKDSITIYLEARDHNKTTGPGIGKSEPITLFVASPEDKHMANIDAQQAVAEALLLHLADFLEAPVGERKIKKNKIYKQVVAPNQNSEDWKQRIARIQTVHNQRPPILEAMEEVAEKLKEDPMMLKRDVTFFSSLLEQLQKLHESGNSTLARANSNPAPNGTSPDLVGTQAVADYAARSEDVLEKGVLRLEELLASQKTDLIQATAEEIRELKERLKQLLEQYRDTQDPELKAAIKRELQRLRQRMAELMARMQMQLQKLPQDHMNMEALKAAQLESDSQQLADQLQSIEEMLDNDDIDGALAALEQMDESLDSLTKDMDKAFSDAEPEGISELDQKVAELLDQANDLESLEKSIEQDTHQLQKDMAERKKESIEKMLKPFTEDMLRRIDEQQKALDRITQRELPERDRSLFEEASTKLKNLREMVEQQDIEQSLERARTSLDSLRALRQMMNLSQRYTPKNSPEHKQTADALGDLNPTVPRGQQIVDELEKMMNKGQQDMQPQDKQALEELAERQQQAAEQAEQLGEQIDEAGQRFPALEQQLKPQIEGAKESMKQAQKSLSEPNTQRALDEERNALDQLGELKQQMRDALQREKNKQRESGESNPERVEIPTQDSRKSHERYRKEVMEGMREGRLEDYQNEIERYYKSLVE